MVGDGRNIPALNFPEEVWFTIFLILLLCLGFVLPRWLWLCLQQGELTWTVLFVMTAGASFSFCRWTISFLVPFQSTQEG